MCCPPLSTAREALSRKQGPELPSTPKHWEDSPYREAGGDLCRTCSHHPGDEELTHSHEEEEHKADSPCRLQTAFRPISPVPAVPGWARERPSLRLRPSICKTWLPSPTSQLSTSSSPHLWTTSVSKEHAVVSTKTWILIPPELGEMSELL